MFCFEIKIVVISIWSKTNFFYFGRFAFGLHFLFLLLFIVKEFIVVNDLTNRWISCWRNFYQVKLLVLRHTQCSLRIINSWFYIITYKSYLRHSYKIVDAMFSFFTGNKSSSEATFVKTTWFVEATTSSSRFVESATTGLKSTLLYCHLNCLVNNCVYVIGDINSIYLPLRRTLVRSVP